MKGNRFAEPGLPLVTHADASDPVAARRARQMARAARVGLLRNPSNPALPPQRRARLMGKWPSLQSSRRPAAQTPERAAATTITDTELARRIMADDPVPEMDAPGPTDRPPQGAPAPRQVSEGNAAAPAERQWPAARIIVIAGLLLLTTLTALGPIL